MIFRYEKQVLIGFYAGQTRSDIQVLFEEQSCQFMKSIFSESLTDVYCQNSVHVHFDANDVLQGVEIMWPNEFICFGGNVLGVKAADIAGWLLEKDSSLNEDDLGFTLNGGRVVLYVPEKGDHPDVLVKDVYVGFGVSANDPCE